MADANEYVWEVTGGEYQFEVYACKERTNLKPSCGGKALVQATAIAEPDLRLMPKELALFENGVYSDGTVDDKQGFEINWSPNLVEDDKLRLLRFEAFGELSGIKYTFPYNGHSYSWQRNQGTTAAPYLNPGRQYCYKVVPIYVDKQTGKEVQGQAANPNPHKCMIVGTDGYLPAPDFFRFHGQPPIAMSATSGVYLSWGAVTGADYYQIDKDFGYTGNWAPLYVGKNLSTVQFLTEHDNVALRISACTADGRCGNYRRIYFYNTPLEYSFQQDIDKTLTCLFVEPLVDNASQIDVQWCGSQHPDIDTYVIKNSFGDILLSTGFNAVSKTHNGMLSAIVDGLSNNSQSLRDVDNFDQQYCFTVEAYYLNDSHGYKTQQQCATLRLATPTVQLTVVNRFQNIHRLSWNRVYPAYFYKVQQAHCIDDCTAIKYTDWEVSTVERVNLFADMNPTANNNYAFRVAACNYTGCSHYSEHIIHQPMIENIRFTHTDNLGSPVAETDIEGKMK